MPGQRTGFWRRTGVSLEHSVDRLQDRLRRRGGGRTLQILPYYGFGNAHSIYLKGRVLWQKPAPLDPPPDRSWTNALATYRRFNSQEVRFQKLSLICNGVGHEIETNQEGYFETWLQNNFADPSGPWLPITVSAVASHGETFTASAEILVPPPAARFGVISDIDDTVVQTHVRSFFKMVRTVLLKGPQGRTAFPGVAAFYRALQRGEALQEFNPVFYVSSGPWNLYDLLVDFFEFNGIPKGPILLQDYGFSESQFFSASHRDHKSSHISQILRAYPDLPFVLIGDSGQHDPEIYRQAMLDAPGRIKAVYIRDVAQESRAAEVRKLAEETEKHGGTLLLVKDTAEAAQDALARGLIHESAIAEIIHAKTAESQPAPVGPAE